MLIRRKMLGMVAGIPLLGGLFGRKEEAVETSSSCSSVPLMGRTTPDLSDDTSWKEVGDDFVPPDGIGTYIVTNDGEEDGFCKVRSGIAQWGYNGKEWEVTDGDIEPDEIYYCIPLPEHPSRT